MYHIAPAGEGTSSTRIIERGTSGIDYRQLRKYCEFSRNIPGLNGYIFYQPGDFHDAVILRHAFLRLWIRIGDLHHLRNPLVNTFQFLLPIYERSEQILLNTNPAFVPLFDYVFPGCKAMPISELTIDDGLLKESVSIAPKNSTRTSSMRLAYIGPTESAFHPRRSLWIRRLLNSSEAERIVTFPTLSPKEWMRCCAEYNTIIAPSLNGQWSHNIFVPNLAGSRIVTDCQSLPSYDYYSSRTTRAQASCMFSSSFRALQICIAKAGKERELAAGTIAENARRHMEMADFTSQNIFRIRNSSMQKKTAQLSERAPEDYLKIVVAANIFEIAQEVIRLMVNYEAFIATCESRTLFGLLSTYFAHPRLILRHERGSITKRKFHRSTMLLQGCNGETGARDILLRIHISIDAFEPSLANLSSRLFEPCKISAYEDLRKYLESHLSAYYSPAEFPQRLVNAISVEY